MKTRSMSISALVVAGLAGSAMGQITPIGPFSGPFSEGFNLQPNATGFPPCVADRVFDNTANLCTFSAPGVPVGGAHITGGWGFNCSIGANLTPRIFGASSGYAEYEFDAPISNFGGYFGTNGSNNVAAGALVTFYDENGAEIGNAPITFQACGEWRWSGWSSTVPIKRISVYGNGYNGSYVMMDDMEYERGSIVTGACCLSDGSCIQNTATSCAAQGGIYRGDGSPCATANCPQPPSGACCFFDGSCQIRTQAQCTSGGGNYRGDGTDCMTVQCPTPPNVVYSNCGFTTGPTTLSGVPAPANSLWSECARDENDPTTANTTAGFAVSGAFRLADDFVVPTGGMNLAYVKVYAYTTGATSPGVTAATLQILDGSPALGGNVVFGDQTTNRLASTGFTDIYRTFNTVTPPTCGGAVTPPGTTRRVQEVYIAVNQFLPAGTYWLDFGITGASFTPTATQSDAIGRQCDPNNSNGLQFNAAWVDANDTGQGCAPVPVQQDFPFELLGTTGSTCYPNCDGSTTPPILNVSDFICFQTKYAANDPYANCDGSTVIPVLNVSDFICFQTMYAAGCS